MNNCRSCTTGLQARHTTDGPADPSYDSHFMADPYCAFAGLAEKETFEATSGYLDLFTRVTVT